MPDHTFSDRLLNLFNAKAQDWGAATESENLPGRTVLRRRDAFYRAQRELTDYVRGLERTIEENEESIKAWAKDFEALSMDLADAHAEIRSLNRTIAERETQDADEAHKRGESNS